MKATLIVIQNEADHADAKRLVEKLMGSSDSQDRARMVARDLRMTMVRRLRERFHISADLLVSRGRARNTIAA